MAASWPGSRRGVRLLAAAAALTAVAAVVSAVRPFGSADALPVLSTAASWRVSTDGDGSGPKAEQAWLARGSVPAAGWTDMTRWALVDLDQLTGPDGAMAAGPAGIWEYAWPRDSAFAVAAFAVTGHGDRARDVLDFLARVQAPDGGFQARYLLDGSGPPDGRTAQSDGTGWALWGLARLVASGDADARVRYDGLLHRSTAFELAGTADGTRLPAPSSDYWERRESRLTLGAAAPAVLGLRSAAAVLVASGDPADVALGRRAATAADRLDRLVAQTFGPCGYQRYVCSGGSDAAVAFLMPPFAPAASADVVSAWQRYQLEALRPGGGLAPGGSWKHDGVSWTPETALVALTAAASGRPDVARRWLDWLDQHRTGWGSIPERVRPDGKPAGPAPLGWSAASTVLAVAALGDPLGRAPPGRSAAVRVPARPAGGAATTGRRP
jgi:glucoamylase